MHKNKKKSTLDANLRIFLSWWMFIFTIYFLFVSYAIASIYILVLIIFIAIVSFWLGIDAILFKYHKINHFSAVIFYRFLKMKLRKIKD